MVILLLNFWGTATSIAAAPLYIITRATLKGSTFSTFSPNLLFSGFIFIIVYNFHFNGCKEVVVLICISLVLFITQYNLILMESNFPLLYVPLILNLKNHCLIQDRWFTAIFLQGFYSFGYYSESIFVYGIKRKLKQKGVQPECSACGYPIPAPFAEKTIVFPLLKCLGTLVKN